MKPADRPAGARQDRAVKARLRECCFRCAPALIVAPLEGYVLQCRFAEVTDEGVAFDLFSTPPRATEPGLMCCVSYGEQDRSCIFIAPVAGRRPPRPPYPEQLVLALPALVSWTEARQSFRVPVVPASGLAVAARIGAAVYLAQPLDLSLCGIGIELAEEAPPLDVGHRLDLELRLGEDTVCLQGRVQRRYERLYGVLFPETVHGRDIRPPEGLRQMLRALERLWLSRLQPAG